MVTSSADEPEPEMEAGLKKNPRLLLPLALSVTVPVNPFWAVTVMLKEPSFPTKTVSEVGDALKVKSPVDEFTVRVTLVAWLSVPLATVLEPLMEIVKGPGGVAAVVVTVMVEEPPVSEGGLKLTPTPAGSALPVLREIVPLNPFCGVTVTV